jgi:hypothetical protein
MPTLPDVWLEFTLVGLGRHARHVARWDPDRRKIRLALEPMVNHFWQVPLDVSAQGVTTLLMHPDTAGLGIDVDVGGCFRLRSAERWDPSRCSHGMTITYELGTPDGCVGNAASVHGCVSPELISALWTGFHDRRISRLERLALIAARPSRRTPKKVAKKAVGPLRGGAVVGGAFTLARLVWSRRRLVPRTLPTTHVHSVRCAVKPRPRTGGEVRAHAGGRGRGFRPLPSTLRPADHVRAWTAPTS